MLGKVDRLCVGTWVVRTWFNLMVSEKAEAGAELIAVFPRALKP